MERYHGLVQMRLRPFQAKGGSILGTELQSRGCGKDPGSRSTAALFCSDRKSVSARSPGARRQCGSLWKGPMQ